MGKNRVDARGRGGVGTVRKAKRPASRGPFLAILALVAVAGIAALAWVSTRPKQTVRTVDPNLPPAKAEGYTLGNPSAPVEIVEFADFECPACGNYATITEPDVRKRLVETGQARMRFYDFPLPMHKNTWTASHAAACANDQGKFWEMHDRLFAGQYEWGGEATSNPLKVIKGYAQQLGLNVDTFTSCVENATHQRQIEANQAEGERRGINQTPTFVIGGKVIPGSLPYDELKKYVDEAAKQAPAAPATVPAGDTTRRATVPATGTGR